MKSSVRVYDQIMRDTCSEYLQSAAKLEATTTADWTFFFFLTFYCLWKIKALGF